MNTTLFPGYTFRLTQPVLNLLQIQNAEDDEFISFARYLGANQRQIDRILTAYYLMQFFNRRDFMSRAQNTMILTSMVRNDLFRPEPYPHIMHMRKEHQHGQFQSL